MTASDHIAALLALVRDAARQGTAEALAAHAAPAASLARLVDRRELARLLSVSQATIARLRGEALPCVHVGEAARFNVAEVEAWLRERGPKPTKAAASKGEAIAGVRLLSRAKRTA